MWTVSPPTESGVRVLNEFCEAIPRYSSSRATAFKHDASSRRGEKPADHHSRVLVVGIHQPVHAPHVSDGHATAKGTQCLCELRVRQERRSSRDRHGIVWGK